MDLAGPGIHVIFGIGENDVKFTLTNVLLEEAGITQAVIPLSARLGLHNGNLHFVPASYRVEDILRLLRHGLELDVFSSAIEKFSKQFDFDYILVDTHPGIEDDTVLVTGVCEGLLLISRLDQQDMTGTAILAKLAASLGKKCFLAFNMVPPNISEASLKDVCDKVSGTFGVKVLGALPFYTEILQSLSRGVFVLNSPNHKYAQRIAHMADALINAPLVSIQSDAEERSQVSSGSNQ